MSWGIMSKKNTKQKKKIKEREINVFNE